MIRVTVDLDHGGLGVKEERLATVLISNVSRLADVSDYKVRVVGKSRRFLPKREALVQGHA